MIKILIDWEALEIAVERNSPHTESFVDRVTGQVLSVVAGEPEAASRKVKITANIEGYVRVEPASSREQYRWMERFVNSVSEEGLKQQLLISIDGKGAFRRFKDVLLAYPVERERWFSYRSNLLHWHIQNWLGTHDLLEHSDPPWGHLSEPEELEEAAPRSEELLASSPVAGEALRRQARDLIDQLMPFDLPNAIAFLEFLRHRSAPEASAVPMDSAVVVIAAPAGPKIVR